MNIRLVHIDGNIIEYSLRKRRGQRSYTLSVHESGKVTLTVPKITSVKSAERFILSKSDWLQKALFAIPNTTTLNSKERRIHYAKHKEKARKFVTKRLKELNAHYKVPYRRVSIRVNSTRWGSCSELGNLNFDYRILFLKSYLQDYLLVHELCHLKEMNHSKRFWGHVQETIPNYREIRKELRRQML